MIVNSAEALSLSPEQVGNKAKNLVWLKHLDMPVPDFFIVTCELAQVWFEQSGLRQRIENNLDQLEQQAIEVNQCVEAIAKAIDSTELDAELVKHFDRNLQLIDPDGRVFFAVRSSIADEDSAAASFAGQMHTCLFQRGLPAILDSYKKCVVSAYSTEALSYRLHHQLKLKDIGIAVVVQTMVESDVSGVMFTCHPVTGIRHHGQISATFGMGEGLVSGLCESDEFTVDMKSRTVIERVINEQTQAMIFDEENQAGLKTVSLAKADGEAETLNESHINQLIEIGNRIARAAGKPQDIEWAIKNNELFLLQTRPITRLVPPNDNRQNYVVWDNSNIQESYCGVTTPLTFNFANRAYETVYTQICEMLPIPEEEVKAQEKVLQNMLGLIKGRVYYNINNWYRGLLILPSFKTNKSDMEKMMGLEDSVDFVEDRQMGAKKKWILIKTLFHMLALFRRLPKMMAAFYDNCEKEFAAVDRKNLHTCHYSTLFEKLRRLELQVLRKWQAPIINDFYVMMTNGSVQRTLEKAKVENPTLAQNNLLVGESDIASTEPTKFLLKLTAKVKANEKLREAFANTKPEHLLLKLRGIDFDFYGACLEYIELYGDRCMGELKLESITLRQDPTFMFKVINSYLKRDDLSLEQLNAKELALREEAESSVFAQVKNNLGGRALRKFKKDLQKFRSSVKNRENLRLERTRLFGLYRDIFNELGQQFFDYKILSCPRDIYYLTLDELEAFHEGRSCHTDLQYLINGRKAEFEAYEHEELPHHFSTNGLVYFNNEYLYENQREVIDEALGDNQMKGIACYPGVIEREVTVVHSPEDVEELNDTILVAVRTDPGWAPLFPTISGLLVEKGSTLSHSAVIARELGIPAIVNIPNLTKTLKTGMRVRLDGSTGVVTILDEQS